MHVPPCSFGVCSPPPVGQRRLDPVYSLIRLPLPCPRSDARRPRVHPVERRASGDPGGGDAHLEQAAGGVETGHLNKVRTALAVRRDGLRMGVGAAPC